METKTKTNIVYNLLYRIVNIVLPLITSPYIARVLGPEGIGAYSFYASIAFYFFSFAMLGINTYGCREIAKCKKENLSSTFWQLYYSQFFLSLLLSAVYLVIALLFFNEFKMVAIIIALYVLSGAFDIDWFAFGLEKFKVTSISRIASKLIMLACLFIFVKNSDDLWKYACIMQFGNIISLVLVWPLVIKYTKFNFPSFRLISGHFKKNIILFLPVIATSVYQYMDKVMIGFITGNTEVGFYNYAENIFAALGSFTIAASTVLLARSSKLTKEDGQDSSIYKSTEYLTMINFALSFGVMAVSNIFIALFLGDDYGRTADILMYLIPVVAVYGINELIRAQVMIPNDMDKQFLIAIAIGAVSNVVFNSFAIYLWGAIGAAIATGVAYLITMIIQLLYTRKKVDYFRIFTRIIPYLLAGLVMFFVVYYADVGFFSNAVLVLLTKIFLGVSIYISLVICYFVFVRRKENIEGYYFSRW